MPTTGNSRKALLLAALVACGANDDIHDPQVAGISPSRARPGDVVTVSGNYFCGQPEDEIGDPLACENEGGVSIGGLPARITEYTDTQIACEVPQLSPGNAKLFVTVVGRTSNTVTLVIE
jgi:uncharacterized protein (TIGR03437 family)